MYTLTRGRVTYTGYEVVKINEFVAKHWPWTRAYTLTTQTGRVAKMLGYLDEYNAIVERISIWYEQNQLSIPGIADAIEQLEAQYDPQPVTIDVTPNVAGDATQLQEVL